VVIASCVIASALSACGSAPAGRGVSLLPDAVAKNQTWRWTQPCPLGPAIGGTCAPSGPNLGHLQLNADDWNLGAAPAGAGSVDMSMSSRGALAIEGHLPSAPPCTRSPCIAPSADTWVRGFPSVLYGINQCSARTSPPVSPALRLPMKVSAIPADLIGTTTYASHTPNDTYDIAYDMWLNPTGTKTPCKTDGTLEVMVWTDYDQGALLPDTVIGTASVPFSVNGVFHPGNDAWSVSVSNVYGGGHTVPWGGTVWIVLNKAYAVSTGTVSVDLSTVFSEVAALLQDDYGWSNFRSYWLDTVPFGMEFGPRSSTVDSTGPSDFSLRLSSYCLGVGMTVSEATCGGVTR